MDDLISRQAALNIAHKLTIPGEEFHQNNQAIGNYMAELVKLPSAQPSATDTNVGGNLIDRQAAISICDNAIDLWNGQLGTGALIAVRDAIKELPSAQRWISCEERLPEKDGEYLVTMLYFGEKTVEVDRFSHYETDDEHNGEPFWMYGYDNVIAWMPRPEAWKGDKHVTSRSV